MGTTLKGPFSTTKEYFKQRVKPGRGLGQPQTNAEHQTPRPPPKKRHGMGNRHSEISRAHSIPSKIAEHAFEANGVKHCVHGDLKSWKRRRPSWMEPKTANKEPSSTASKPRDLPLRTTEKRNYLLREDPGRLATAT